MRADKDFRIARAIETEKIAEAEAKDFLKKSDKRRSSFYNTHTGWKWGDMSKFDLCMDSHRLRLCPFFR